MKKLVENSIKISGIGPRETKTEFDLLNTKLGDSPSPEEVIIIEGNKKINESILNDIRYKSLSRLSGRLIAIFFSFEENGEIFKDRLQLKLPVLDGEDMKNYIISEIENKLI